MINYEGIFFDKETTKFIHSLEKYHLPITNDEMHCTFKYQPSKKEVFNELVGKEIEVLLIGYGYDGNNSGFLVQLPSEIMKYYINFDEQNPTILKKPHITTSLAENAKAYKTKDLNFEPLDITYKVKGKFGFWIKNNEREYLSFDIYNN